MAITYQLLELYIGSFMHVTLKCMLSVKPKTVPGVKGDSSQFMLIRIREGLGKQFRKFTLNNLNSQLVAELLVRSFIDHMPQPH